MKVRALFINFSDTEGPLIDVRFTLNADMIEHLRDVRFCAKSGLLQRSKAEQTRRCRVRVREDLTQCSNSNYTGARFSAVDLKEVHKLNFRRERFLVNHFDALSHAARSQCG